MSGFDLQVPFLKPVWRRVALVSVCLGWALLEWLTREPFWTMIFGALGVYAAWQLFFRPWPDGQPESTVSAVSADTVSDDEACEAAQAARRDEQR